MVTIDVPSRQDYPGLFGAYDYIELGFIILGLIAVLCGIGIMFTLLDRWGLEAHRDVLSPGLRFPPGHMAHIAMFTGIDLLRAFGFIVVGLTVVERIDFAHWLNNNFWEIFMIAILPMVFWMGTFIVMAEMLKVMWIGGPDRWAEYINAYENTPQTYGVNDYIDDEIDDIHRGS
tara:strand:- start:9022 stop:9543 length:522 start_codon:yes stop_codon:yes gene_type:complete